MTARLPPQTPSGRIYTPKRTYTPEQRAEALRLALEFGVAKAARRLNMNADTLEGWVQKHRRGEA